MPNKRPIIYVESVTGGPHGPLTLEHIERALGNRVGDYDLVIADSATPDLCRLRVATYFVSTRFDVERMRRHAPAVRLVHSLNAGVERYLPINWLPDGAILTNSSGVHADMVGEYATMALLMLNHKLQQYIDLQRVHLWEKLPASPIRGKTVLIIGTGGLGRAIASQARQLGLDVIGVSRQGLPCKEFDRIEPIDVLDSVLPMADFIILACPLTESTRYMFDASRFSCCRDGAGLINVGRGQLVDTEALAEALRSERLAGAILDVQEIEPIPFNSKWWSIKHLILTPHISCDTAQGYFDRGLSIFVENLDRFRDGRPLQNIVDLEQGY